MQLALLYYSFLTTQDFARSTFPVRALIFFYPRVHKSSVLCEIHITKQTKYTPIWAQSSSNTRTSRREKILVSANTIVWLKWLVHRKVLVPGNWLQGLVARTCPIVCADLHLTTEKQKKRSSWCFTVSGCHIFRVNRGVQYTWNLFITVPGVMKQSIRT